MGGDFLLQDESLVGMGRAQQVDDRKALAWGGPPTVGRKSLDVRCDLAPEHSFLSLFLGFWGIGGREKWKERGRTACPGLADEKGISGTWPQSELQPCDLLGQHWGLTDSPSAVPGRSSSLQRCPKTCLKVIKRKKKPLVFLFEIRKYLIKEKLS